MNFDVLSPKSITDWQKAMKSLKGKKVRYGAGYTDLLMELKRPEITDDFMVLNLAQIKDSGFTHIKESSTGLTLGAMVTAHELAYNDQVDKMYPVLCQASSELASTQIRQVATIGGNMCTASPSGDMACAIMALDAECTLLASDGKKRRVAAAEFFKGVRRTCLKKDELLYSIKIPKNNTSTHELHSGFIKIGTRQAMECSVVSLAYHIQLDKKGVIIQAGIAVGASAPTIFVPQKAIDLIVGKEWRKINETDKNTFAKLVVQYASPITDVRATDWYRKEVLFNISKSVLEK